MMKRTMAPSIGIAAGVAIVMGTTDPVSENGQTTCPWCNNSKNNRDYPVNPPPGYRGPWPPWWWRVGDCS